MLETTENIGSDNPMANNIYMAYVFMAIYKAADGKIKAADFREVTAEFMQHPLVKKFMGGVDVNREENMEKINITGVPETMLQTFYARAKESRKPNHKIYDAKAVEIVEKMDYDFSNADKDALMSSGVIARTILLDRMVNEYINEHPKATVVNIACGLDTRYYRVDNGNIRWYNLDLPETIAVRKRFMNEDGRVSMIARSAMDKKWTDEIEDTEGNVLVVVEGLSMYLSEEDVKQILTIIAGKFSKVTVYMEIMNPLVVGKDVEKSIKSSNAKFTWGAKSGKELESLVPAFQYQNDRSLVEVMKELYPIYKVIGKVPFIRNLSNKISVLKKE